MMELPGDVPPVDAAPRPLAAGHPPAGTPAARSDASGRRPYRTSRSPSCRRRGRPAPGAAGAGALLAVPPPVLRRAGGQLPDDRSRSGGGRLRLPARLPPGPPVPPAESGRRRPGAGPPAAPGRAEPARPLLRHFNLVDAPDPARSAWPAAGSCATRSSAAARCSTFSRPTSRPPPPDLDLLAEVAIRAAAVFFVVTPRSVVRRCTVRRSRAPAAVRRCSTSPWSGGRRASWPAVDRGRR